MAIKLEEYAGKYKFIKMERTDGILQMTLHSKGGPLKWGLRPHEELSTPSARSRATARTRP
jgi:hypothetical protein